MSSNPSADPETGASLIPDPHGHAAILLVESLIHGLIARKILTVTDAIEIVDTATEVSLDIAGDHGDGTEDLRKSVALLESISASLRQDLPR